MKTEDEAEKTWCPHLRILTLGNYGDSNFRYITNRGKVASHIFELDTKCITNKCCLWETDEDTDLGYCGLSGANNK